MANKAVIAVVAIAGVGIVAYLLWKYLKNYSPQSALESLQNALTPYLNNSQALNQVQEEEVGGNPLQTITKSLGNGTNERGESKYKNETHRNDGLGMGNSERTFVILRI